MSALRKEEELSPDELRKRLYQTFKSKGLLDTLKTQMRNQLIQELRHPPSAQSKAPESGLVAACNSIVSDYLRNSGYEYSLSVFNPECGLSKDKMLSKQDILQFVKISPDSSLYKALLNQENCEKSFLVSLLTQLSHCPVPEGSDVVTQTSMTNHGESLVEKLKMIDKEYDKHSFRGDTFFTLQSKLESYKKEIEERLQAEMRIKLQHFKDVELAKMQIEEKDKFNKEFIKAKHELEEMYQMKTKILTQREKNNIAQLQKQQEIEGRNAYMQRQEVLKEIEAVRNRESELRIKVEAFEKNGQIHEEKVKTTVELLRRREIAVKTLEDTYDQRLRNELSRYQLELKEEFVRRTEKLTENETQNKMEAARLLKESSELDAKLEEHVRVSSEIKQLKIELSVAQQQQTILNDQKELLKEKLETMSDYSSLKSERAELQEQLRLLGKRLDEAFEENSHLHLDLQRMKSAQRQSEEDWDQWKQVLQAKLQREVEHSAELKTQLMECEEKAKWMNHHVDDIKIQLQHTQQALENEVLRKPKSSVVDHSILEVCTDLVPPDIYGDRNTLKVVAPYDLSKADGSLHGHAWGNTLDSDVDLIADAKARMLELQREAETIEEAYRNYQQRAVVSNISHMLIPRPLSPQYPSRTHRVPPPKATRTPLLTHDTRKPSESQYKVTFLENPVETTPLGFSAGPVAHHKSLYERNRHFEEESPLLTGRQSPLQESHSRIMPQRVTEAAPLMTLLEDLHHSQHKAVSSDDFLSELSPPHSPQLRSTARNTSPPRLNPASSSSESSPQPEKIRLEDLTEPVPEQSHIPELLLDTGVPEGPAVPRPQSPQDLQRDPPEDSQSSCKSSDEEQKWEKERRERQEERLREQEDARERELQELERLEQEHLSQEGDQATAEEEVKHTENGARREEQEAKDDGEECKDGENPLEKYMKMVLEARQKQQASPEQEAKPLSFEDKSLLEDKEESIAAYSHKEEEEDFW